MIQIKDIFNFLFLLRMQVILNLSSDLVEGLGV